MERPGALHATWFFALGMLLASPAMSSPGDIGTTDPTVSVSTGESRYRIPIEVPPGPGGFTPQLALAYSSRAGDGPYGVGWRLGPLGEVRCSARFGVPDYANCSRYELDDQLLTEDPATPGRFHTFVESFMRVLQLTSSWEVTAPNGVTYRYGISDESRIYAGPDPQSDPVARWLLAERYDRKLGNGRLRWAAYSSV